MTSQTQASPSFRLDPARWPHTAQPSERYLRRWTVEQMCSLPTSTLYYLMARGEFPANVQLSRRIVAWKESAILAWLASRPTYQSKTD